MGNGTFDAASGGRDYGDSLLKLGLDSSSIVVQDYFTPFNQAQLNDADADLGSSGPILLPDQPGAHRHLVLQPGKNSMIYVIDRDQMGEFHAQGDAVVQRIHMSGSGMGAVAYWSGHIYFACSDERLRDYALENGQLKLRSSSSTKFDDPGGTPSVSADANKNAIVWAIATKTWNGADRTAVLYAFDANNIQQPICTSEQNSKRDRAATATRFAIPLVVNARVFWGERGSGSVRAVEIEETRVRD